MKIAVILLALLMLFGCTEAKAADIVLQEPVPEIVEEEIAEEIIEEPEEPKIFKITELEYNAPESKTPEKAVRNSVDALYDSYLLMLPVDISPVIDKDFDMMNNVQNWNNLLAMRRSIIAENDYCYVEKQISPYTINFITEKELDDQRMDYVYMRNYGEGAVAVHFVIKGVEGKAYPPIFAVNSQHSMVLTFEDGVYKIAYHYFPGSERKFENDLPSPEMEREEMEELLAEEFAPKEKIVLPEAKFERLYNGEEAVGYAFEFCEKHNPEFYFVGDWFGNCMNFASQCIWSGFREEEDTPKNYGSMSRDWYCGKGNGTFIWTSVSRFYAWTETKKCDIQTFVFKDVNQAANGDLVHIGSYLCEMEEKYTHALIVVDSEKLLLAQNSPACFVYYSDLVNNYSRFIRPISLDA